MEMLIRLEQMLIHINTDYLPKAVVFIKMYNTIMSIVSITGSKYQCHLVSTIDF